MSSLLPGPGFITQDGWTWEGGLYALATSGSAVVDSTAFAFEGHDGMLRTLCPPACRSDSASEGSRHWRETSKREEKSQSRKEGPLRKNENGMVLVSLPLVDSSPLVDIHPFLLQRDRGQGCGEATAVFVPDRVGHKSHRLRKKAYLEVMKPLRTFQSRMFVE